MPSARSVTKNSLSVNNRSTINAPSRKIKDEFIDYTALDTFR